MNERINRIFLIKFTKIGISIISGMMMIFSLLFFLELNSQQNMYLRNSKKEVNNLQRSLLYQINNLAEWINYYRESEYLYSAYDGNETNKNYVYDSLRRWVKKDEVLIAAVLYDINGERLLSHAEEYNEDENRAFLNLKDQMIKDIKKDEYHMISKLNKKKDNTYFIHFTTVYDGDIKKGYMAAISDMKKMVIHYGKYYREKASENRIGFARVVDENTLKGVILDEKPMHLKAFKSDFNKKKDYLLTEDQDYIILSENPEKTLEETGSLKNYKVKFEDKNREAAPMMIIDHKKISDIRSGIKCKYLYFFSLTTIVSLIAIYRHLKMSFEKDLNERRLRVKTNKLNKNIASINTIVSIVGHDIKGPFTSLLGGLSIINKKITTIDREKLIVFLKHMEEDCRKACHISENLMKWAISQNGFYSYLPQNIELSEVIQEQVDEYRGMAKLKEILLKTDIPEGLLCYSDRDILKTVIRNLLINSIKFTSLNGTIMIKATQSKNKVELTLEDTGTGIPKNVLKMIERDTAYSSPGSKGELGNGMGLILIKKLCRINMSTLKISSDVGRGTSITVKLPKKKNKLEFSGA